MVSSATDDERHKSTVAIPMGEEIRLDARIAGQPRPEVTWYHNERRVKETETVKVGCTKTWVQLLQFDSGSMPNNGKRFAGTVTWQNKHQNSTTQA